MSSLEAELARMKPLAAVPSEYPLRYPVHVGGRLRSKAKFSIAWEESCPRS